MRLDDLAVIICAINGTPLNFIDVDGENQNNIMVLILIRCHIRRNQYTINIVDVRMTSEITYIASIHHVETDGVDFFFNKSTYWTHVYQKYNFSDKHVVVFVMVNYNL